jgi:mpaB/rubber oxygenase-like protein
MGVVRVMTTTQDLGWQARLHELRQMTDPEIDDLVDQYRRDHPDVDTVRSLVMQMLRELGEAKADPGWRPATTAGQAGERLSSLLNPPPLPLWAEDKQQIDRGQELFRNTGLYQAVALFFASLPMAYAARDGGAQALYRVSDLATQNLTRRVAETGQMLIDVMGIRDSNTLEPGGTGYETAIGLRLLHSCVRALLLDPENQEPWPSDLGPPVNQELLLATLLDFTIVTWRAMGRMGVELEPQDREAHLYTWSVMGWLMGLDACQQGPLTRPDVEEISSLLSDRLGATDSGRRLMAALLAEMEEFMGLGWRKLPRSLVHWLFRDAPYGVNRVPEYLDVGPPAWWAGPLFGCLRAANRRERLLGPLRPMTRLVIRKAGRYIILAYADKYADRPLPFRIPPELARSWRIRQGPVARTMRERRRAVRQRVRTRRGDPLGTQGVRR